MSGGWRTKARCVTESAQLWVHHVLVVPRSPKRGGLRTSTSCSSLTTFILRPHYITRRPQRSARGGGSTTRSLCFAGLTYRACDIFFAGHWLAGQISFSLAVSMSLLGENLRPRTLLRKLSNVGRQSRSRASAVDEVHPFRLLDLPPEIVEVILSLSRSMDVLALRMVRVYCILLSLNKCTNV